MTCHTIFFFVYYEEHYMLDDSLRFVFHTLSKTIAGVFVVCMNKFSVTMRQLAWHKTYCDDDDDEDDTSEQPNAAQWLIITNTVGRFDFLSSMFGVDFNNIFNRAVSQRFFGDKCRFCHATPQLYGLYAGASTPCKPCGKWSITIVGGGMIFLCL
jgi:hypothetical protein